jgi:hypothetical protein
LPIDVVYIEVVYVDVNKRSEDIFCAFLSGNVSIQKSDIDITITITEMTATILAYIDECGYS